MVKESKTALKNYPNLKLEVYQLVKKIPKGKVATYGQIATLSQKSKVKSQKYNSKFKISPKFMPRLVGFVLHQNKDPDVPCHRVVDRNGRIAVNFGFGGASEQRLRLMEERVKFKDEMHVDLAKCLWRGNPKS